MNSHRSRPSIGAKSDRLPTDMSDAGGAVIPVSAIHSYRVTDGLTQDFPGIADNGIQPLESSPNCATTSAGGHCTLPTPLNRTGDVQRGPICEKFCSNRVARFVEPVHQHEDVEGYCTSRTSCIRS